ncbi:MAG: helix-turn-helix domain-containing protein [Oscillospiraceae bacterium]|nr:helix-turn-helix domain-containing protein [Oscillospiraceae bacterium]
MLKERLIELRKRSGLTQANLAKHLQITRQAYSCYESGRREMDFASLCSIADFYNVPTDYLLGREAAVPVTVAADEIAFIDKYRLLDGRGKSTVKATLESELAYAIKTEAVKK